MRKTSEDLSATLREAADLVAAADLPEPYRAHAYKRALDVLLGIGVVSQQVGGHTGGGATAGGGVGVAGGGSSAGQPLGRIAGRAGVSLEQVQQVYRYDGGTLSVVVGHKKIDSSSARGSRELTLLVAGARQAAGLEEWTPLSQARDVCSTYGRLDSANFATTIRAMDDEFAFHGGGASREVRLTMAGWDAWTELVKRLVKG